MKNHLFLISFTSKFPLSVQKIPYFFALKLSQFCLKFFVPSIEAVWARHSYDCSYFVAGLSDLDLTIICKSKLTSEEQVSLIQLLSTLKKLIPFLGEVNIFTPELMHNLKHFANKYEIQRDMKTLKHFNLDLTSPYDKAQALVFVLRAIQSNSENLSLISHVRLKKWEYYLSLINSGEKQKIQRNDLLMHIQNNANFLLDQLNMSSFSLNSFLTKKMDPHQAFVLFPSKWVSDSFYLENFEEKCGNEVSLLNEHEALIVLYQFRWDIFGIASQIHRYNERQSKDMSNFTNRIKLVGEKIGERFFIEEYNDLAQRIIFFNTYLSSM